jgi:hypothetical protein
MTENTKLKTLIPKLEDMTYTIKGQRVILDLDLAELYQVTTSKLNKAVKKHIDRFPPDFMFQLTEDEFKDLMAKKGTPSKGKLPYVFTEGGVFMVSGLFKSDIATAISIEIIQSIISARRYVLKSGEFGEDSELFNFQGDNVSTKQFDEIINHMIS